MNLVCFFENPNGIIPKLDFSRFLALPVFRNSLAETINAKQPFASWILDCERELPSRFCQTLSAHPVQVFCNL